MSRDEPIDRFWDDTVRGGFRSREPRYRREDEKEEETDSELLPTISIVHLPHDTIRNLYQHCFEYIDPLGWSAEAELVETGRWFFRPSEPEH